MRQTAAVGLLLLGTLTACESAITGGPDAGLVQSDGGVVEPDAGTLQLDGGICATAAAVAEFFRAEGCLNCHAGLIPPDLRFTNFPRLINAASVYRPTKQLVVPGQPDQSELLLRLKGPQPTDYPNSWFMPVGAAGAHRNAAIVETWIAANAELDCSQGVVVTPPPPTVTNPNHYDQATLFTCSDPMAPRSSPARLRRINAREFTLAAGGSVGSRWTNAVVASNPLVTPEKGYSSHSGDLSLDGTSLELLLSTLNAASNPWTTRAQGSPNGGRYWTVFDGTPAAFYTSANPTSADRDVWVEALLRQGVLFRTPTADERQRVRALLDAEIAAEAGQSDGGTNVSALRSQSLRTVASAAKLMAGALFRSELGEGAGTRRALAPEELALAVGTLIGAHPVSSTLWGTVPSDAGVLPPDWSRRVADGRLAEVRDAVDGGAITQKSTIAALLTRYRGGVDPFRVNLMSEMHRTDEHAAQLRERGEFWLSDALTRFFHEWLDVKRAETHFKDTPNATSGWVVARSSAEAAGFGAVQPSLVKMLDDTIARAVIEAEQNNQDVFRALLTTRTWRVTTNLDGVDTARPCTVPADCGDFRVGACYTALGFCAAFGTTERNRVFNLATDVADTRAARWVTMPAAERSGILTHPAFLAAHGGNFEDDASLVLRGHWLRENLLCSDVPGLELVSVPAMLAAKGPTLRARDRVRDATEQPGSACLTCHVQMNPYGYPFELYNHAGFVRVDDHGRPPDGSTTITNSPDPSLNRSYASPVEFTEALAASPYARRCFIRNVFRSFMGRNETPADACTLAEMESAFATGSLFKMLEVLGTSDTFLYRSDVGGAP